MGPSRSWLTARSSSLKCSSSAYSPRSSPFTTRSTKRYRRCGYARSASKVWNSHSFSNPFSSGAKSEKRFIPNSVSSPVSFTRKGHFSPRSAMIMLPFSRSRTLLRWLPCVRVAFHPLALFFGIIIENAALQGLFALVRQPLVIEVLYSRVSVSGGHAAHRAIRQLSCGYAGAYATVSAALPLRCSQTPAASSAAEYSSPQEQPPPLSLQSPQQRALFTRRSLMIIPPGRGRQAGKWLPVYPGSAGPAGAR